MTDIVFRLIHSITTASNDDVSEPMTEKRRRHVERVDTLREAADEIERLQKIEEVAKRWWRARHHENSETQELQAELLSQAINELTQ